MNSQQDALITPKVLEWARKRARLTVEAAAHAIKRPIEEIEKWEAEELLPSLAQARKAAEVYRVALAVFYLDTPPALATAVLKDFRANRNALQWSPELTGLITEYSKKQTWLSEYLAENGGAPLSMGSMRDLAAKPIDIAAEIRRRIDFSLERQMDCRNPLKAYNAWIEAVERFGINVCRKGGAEIEEVRGFALYDEYVPFIYVNSDDSYSGRLFTLIHELVHIWIKEPGVSDGSLPSAASDEGKIEVFCNEVASKILVDDNMLLRYWRERDKQLILNEQIGKVAREFSVSEEVIARCLLKQGEIVSSDYDSLRVFYRRRWEEYKNKQKGFLKYGLKMVLENGRYFTHTVLAGYASKKLSGIGASQLLNVKISNFPKLREYLPPVLPKL